MSTKIEERPPAVPGLKYENRIVWLWSLTVWLVVMNTTMFNVALPSVLRDLSLSSGTASWIVSGYSIAFAISTLTYSRLSDFIPISRLLAVGLAMLGAASIIGFFSHNFYLLLSARVLQAAGAGAVPGLAMVLAGKYIPISRRGKAMSLISSAASLGFGLGPVIGGAITTYLGWNYLFVITAFVVLLLPLFKKLLPKEEVHKVHFDSAGGLLTGLGVTGLLLFLSTMSVPLLIGSLAILYLLWRHIHKVSMPFVQPSLFKNRQYVKLALSAFSGFILHFSALFMMPIILSELFGKDPAAIGLIIFPGAILSAVAAQFIGRLIDRFGNIPLISFGHVMLLISLLILALFSGEYPYAILVAYMFMSTGFSSLTSSIANEASRILPEDEIGSGMGLMQLIQFFGGAFGVALSGLLIEWQQGVSVTAVYTNIFWGMALLIISSFFVFLSYIKRDAKKSLQY
ncbi:MFS transporter [Peribacillus frigoritolerans]|uniref:MFS transporter n=1 Tax=Peribacillus frigoritolerans TaxID=450367 RepID=UPI00105A2B13|nr:MFS transporter [Peribacillus frigoritolerans]TDL82392.1 MFS transporter [Peribacillus frigoritolerans]